jgi:CRISPR-associated protein Cmr4
LGCADFYSYEQNPLKESEIQIELEGSEVVKLQNCESIKPLIGENFAVVKKLCDYDLPVRARNKLDESGISENLWYEEIVPHKSIFYFAIITHGDHCELEFKTDSPVQFGGNASIGNGYCTIKEVFPR